MQEANWMNFAAKFNGKERKSFEWLCYLLFCREFDCNLGINRYSDHAGVETAPIQVDEEYYAWQAKYYTTPLSQKTQEFISAIETAKRNHPEITKILFYTNSEFGQGRDGGDPKGKIEIEAFASSKDIELDWRTASFFESPFVAQDNEQIAKYFFDNSGNSIFDLVEKLRNHTEDVLGLIHSEIKHTETSIKIDRSNEVQAIGQALKRPDAIILNGSGGVGKTAIIKDFYDQVNENIPVFLFKAAEFSGIAHVDDLFKKHGDFTLQDFAILYSDAGEKCIVIDSAEKISEYHDQTVFQEFLFVLIKHNWKLIFTTRQSYLEDIKYLLTSLFQIPFTTIDLFGISMSKLEELAESNNLTLPNDENVKELICNPFYLSEFVRSRPDLNDIDSTEEFKNEIWNRHIARTSIRKENIHTRRQETFIKLSKCRADKGDFYIGSNGFDPEALSSLLNDEIIGYDQDRSAYFISHDIYEEWGLERFIEAIFLRSDDTEYFYQSLGESLAIRRAFRTWLIHKLASNKETVKELIENTLSNTNVLPFWQDEVLVSILRSEETPGFVEVFDRSLLDNDCELLVRLIFLLRIACKEIDSNILKLIQLDIHDEFASILYTKPIGSGWGVVINFIYDHKEELKTRHIEQVMQLLKDWVTKNNEGVTTKQCAQLALFFYGQVTSEGSSGVGILSRQSQEDVLYVILHGALEIKDELASLIERIITENEIEHSGMHRKLVNGLLGSSFDTFLIAKALPLQLIHLAEAHWLGVEDRGPFIRSTSIGVESSFGLSSVCEYEYEPASSFQTPIYMLLRFAQDVTIDFIIRFTNACVETYANSELGKEETGVIEINFGEDGIKEQVISSRLWSIYRGSHVNPSVLESMHMALEKWLLEQAEEQSSEYIEGICFRLLTGSISASITSTIVSVILAYPDKMFNVASVLFRTQELFSYDRHRFIQESTYRLTAAMPGATKDSLHYNDRIKSCDQDFRKKTLEGQALLYQHFKTDIVTEEEGQQRLDTLWAIWDEYYAMLPAESEQTPEDKAWRLCLARMDRRGMSLEVEELNGQVLLSFHPEIDTDLENYSTATLQETQEAAKYSDLNIWAWRSWRKEKDLEDYAKFADNPSHVIAEVKNLIADFEDENYTGQFLVDESVIAYACSTLIRDFSEMMSDEERMYCKDILLDFSTAPFREGFQSEIGSGLDAVVNVLPLLLGIDSQDDSDIKTILLLTLFNSAESGKNTSLRSLAAETIRTILLPQDPQAAQAIFIGYLALYPLWETIYLSKTENAGTREMYREGFRKSIGQLLDEQEALIERVTSNVISDDDIQNVSSYDITALKISLLLIPEQDMQDVHTAFMTAALPLIAKDFFAEHNRQDYETDFLVAERLACMLISAPEDDIRHYAEVLAPELLPSTNADNLLDQIIVAEDKAKYPDSFWIIWNSFYEKIKELATSGKYHRNTDSTIKTYLFGATRWVDPAKGWSTFREDDKAFFERVAKDMGKNRTVVLSLAKFLCGVGSSYAEYGAAWLSIIIENNSETLREDIESDTISYLENYIRRLVLSDRKKIRSTRLLKKQVLIILDFLIEKGSVAAYLARESIL